MGYIVAQGKASKKRLFGDRRVCKEHEEVNGGTGEDSYCFVSCLCCIPLAKQCGKGAYPSFQRTSVGSARKTLKKESRARPSLHSGQNLEQVFY